ncbi:MAG: cytochrome c [Gammaproteobacteria bacterium]|nr:MAG: cytochrome c [Gammaproteobacteria bacterium]
MERQALMKSALKSYFPLLAVYNGKSTNLTKAGEAARKLKDDMAKSLALFSEGTAKDQVPGSRAKPEIWSEASDFEAAGNVVISSVDKLIEILASGDVEAFKVQFSLVEQACLGCHEFKPSGGGKFRFGK